MIVQSIVIVSALLIGCESYEEGGIPQYESDAATLKETTIPHGPYIGSLGVGVACSIVGDEIDMRIIKIGEETKIRSRPDMECVEMSTDMQRIVHCIAEIEIPWVRYRDNITIVLNRYPYDVGIVYLWKEFGDRMTCVMVFWITGIEEERT